MAYKVIDPIVLTPKVVNSTTYAVTISDYNLTLVDDDYIVLYVHTHATTGTLSIAGSGWSELVELDVTSGGQMAVYACKVAAGAVADPTITATVTTTWQVVLEQWRDVDTTTFAEIPTPTQANASSVASATFTPAAADSTIVYFGAVRGSAGQHCRFLSDKVVASANPRVDISFNSFAMAIGTVQQTAAAVTAQTMYAAESARIGVITLAVKNKSGGKVARDCRAAMTKVGWFGDYGTAHESLGSLTFNAPSTFCVWSGGTEAFAGIDVATAALTPTHTMNGLPPLNGRYTDMPSTTNTAGQWVGVWWATPSTLDMTGQIFTMEWFMALLGDAVGEKGAVIAFGDDAAADTGNAVVFQLAPKLQIPLNTLLTSHIAVETATQLASVGSINWATVKKMGIFYHRAGSNTNSRSVSWRNMFLHGSSIMTGGNATRPLNGQFLDNALNGWGYTGLCTKSGDAMLAKTSIQFGDGTKPTYVDTTATLLNTPAKYSTNSQALWNVPANTITVGVKGASGDTLNFTSSALVAGPGAEQNFTVDAATSSGATVSTQGGVFGNWLWTGDTDFDPTGATYSGCDEVAWGGATVTNCSVTNTTSADAAASVDANTTITSTPIDGTGALYALELGTAVTAITLTDCTITAGSTDKVHVLKTLSNVAAGAFVVGVHYRINTVGTTDFTAIGASANTIGVNFTAAGAGTGTGTADEAVKITISGSTSLSETDVTTAGAPAWISAPELNQSVVVSGFTAGSRIQIYDTTNSEELFNGTATAGDTVVSGTTATWTDPLAASGTRAIRVRVSYVNGATAKQFIETSGLTCGITEGTESVTYPISQVADETYDNNGIDGPAIYATSGITFTDAATDLVNISIAGGAVTWPTIYACFVYWIFTAAGIDDDVAYIDAPDTANYLLTSMKLKNTHANPLTVTSGFGRSATTGLVADIIDAAGSTGNIYPTPDHVVAYATGSGALTAGDITNIWSAATRTITTTIPSDTDNAAAVLAAAQTTPIHADIRKVNNHTVDGVGSDADPWGPA